MLKEYSDKVEEVKKDFAEKFAAQSEDITKKFTSQSANINQLNTKMELIVKIVKSLDDLIKEEKNRS